MSLADIKKSLLNNNFDSMHTTYKNFDLFCMNVNNNIECEIGLEFENGNSEDVIFIKTVIYHNIAGLKSIIKNAIEDFEHDAQYYIDLYYNNMLIINNDGTFEIKNILTGNSKNVPTTDDPSLFCDSAVIIETVSCHGGTAKQNEYKNKDFVFSKYLKLSSPDITLYIKPSASLKYFVEKCYNGYKIESIEINNFFKNDVNNNTDSCRVVCHLREIGGINFSCEFIVCDVLRYDLYKFIIDECIHNNVPDNYIQLYKDNANINPFDYAILTRPQNDLFISTELKELTKKESQIKYNIESLLSSFGFLVKHGETIKLIDWLNDILSFCDNAKTKYNVEQTKLALNLK